MVVVVYSPGRGGGMKPFTFPAAKLGDVRSRIVLPSFRV